MSQVVAGAFKDHFSGVAAQYAAFRPEYPRELFEWLATIAPAHTRTWDCATGNGQAAVPLSEFFAEVHATDASAEQISAAAKHARIQYAIAPAEKSGLGAQSIDLVTVAQAAHWFDLPKFYEEARRVLKPGGVLALCCYGKIDFADRAIRELVDHFYTDVVGPFWPPERRHIEEGYRTLPFPFREFTAPRFEMNATLTLERFLGYLRTWSATQRFRTSKGFDPVEALGTQLAPFWEGELRSPAISWPIRLRVGQV